MAHPLFCTDGHILQWIQQGFPLGTPELGSSWMKHTDVCRYTYMPHTDSLYTCVCTHSYLSCVSRLICVHVCCVCRFEWVCVSWSTHYAKSNISIYYVCAICISACVFVCMCVVWCICVCIYMHMCVHVVPAYQHYQTRSSHLNQWTHQRECYWPKWPTLHFSQMRIKTFSFWNL